MNRIRARLNSLRAHRRQAGKGTGRVGHEVKSLIGNRGFDLTTFIAALALVVSAAQLFVTAPVLLQIFVKPELKVHQVEVKGATEEYYSGAAEIFLVKNEGSAPATKVELGLIVFEDQKVTVIPKVGGRQISEQKDFLTSVRVEFEHLQSGEEIFVMVSESNLLKNGDERHKEANKRASAAVPAISFLRSSEGPGKIKRTLKVSSY